MTKIEVARLENDDTNAVVQSAASPDEAFGVVIFRLEQANRYLWIILGLLAFFTLVAAGFYLLTAQGEEDKFKKSQYMLAFSLIALLVGALAGAIIRISLYLLD